MCTLAGGFEKGGVDWGEVERSGEHLKGASDRSQASNRP